MSGSGEAHNGAVRDGPPRTAAGEAPAARGPRAVAPGSPRDAAVPAPGGTPPHEPSSITAAGHESRSTTAAAPPLLEVVLPVFNEQRALAGSVRKLRDYLDAAFPFPAMITIADNASTDATWWIARRLADTVAGVRAVRLHEKGRGRALRAVWTASTADLVAYMDIDLATDLRALLPLVAPLLSGHSDVAIGSRLVHGARVTRGLKREAISRCYNLIVKATLHTRFSDAQCGFKALRGEVARDLAPQVADDGWFFDTELLVLAERHGLRIHEVPVDWVDDPDSRVDIRQTAVDDLKGIWRLMWARPTTSTRRSPSLLQWHEQAPAPALLPRHEAWQ